MLVQTKEERIINFLIEIFITSCCTGPCTSELILCTSTYVPTLLLGTSLVQLLVHEGSNLCLKKEVVFYGVPATGHAPVSMLLRAARIFLAPVFH
jgi:hypothetical protein